MLGSDVPDPGMVNEGTKCGDNKCRSADVLSYNCDVEKKCHGHGVCNSNRNCHCEDGWAPPFCEVKGVGLRTGPSGNWIQSDWTGNLPEQTGSSYCLLQPVFTLFLYLKFKTRRRQLKCRLSSSQPITFPNGHL
uniref:EGF-like domain-containing protein n=1 Tax=Seriola lalandi dorsalis TaxID=1841481 RepID=A0A3B4Y5R3_SERLL